MATIRIKRTNEYNNCMKDYKIFIDGQQAGIIKNGETKEFSALPGQHTLTAKIGWCSSPDLSFEMNENEVKSFKAGGFKNGNWIMPLTGGIIALHFILKLATNSNYTIFLVIPAFLLLIYYITIGRKKYLILTETESYN